jgi:hypothetical protein
MNLQAVDLGALGVIGAITFLGSFLSLAFTAQAAVVIRGLVGGQETPPPLETAAAPPAADAPSFFSTRANYVRPFVSLCACV